MTRLVQKSGYVKQGNAGGYMKYIATREGVEIISRDGPVTENQEKLIRDLLRDFPDSAELFEYADYLASPSRKSASAYITMALDTNAQSWRHLLTAHQEDIGKAMHIPTEQLNWYAAYHDESYHPHIHMMIWSDDPKQGYLTKAGIAAMRSALTNDIFRDELLSLYKEKDLSYKKLTRAAKRRTSALASLPLRTSVWTMSRKRKNRAVLPGRSMNRPGSTETQRPFSR